MRWWCLAVALAAPPSGEVVAACDRAVAEGDDAALEQCVTQWVVTAPGDPSTDWYAFHLAVLRGDATAAEAARRRALTRGIDEERARVLGETPLPANPMVTLQRAFFAAVLVAAMGLLVWARVRNLRGVDA